MANLIVFCRFTSIYIFNTLEVEVKIRLQKMAKIKVKVTLFLVRVF